MSRKLITNRINFLYSCRKQCPSFPETWAALWLAGGTVFPTASQTPKQRVKAQWERCFPGYPLASSLAAQHFRNLPAPRSVCLFIRRVTSPAQVPRGNIGSLPANFPALTWNTKRVICLGWGFFLFCLFFFSLMPLCLISPLTPENSIAFAVSLSRCI